MVQGDGEPGASHEFDMERYLVETTQSERERLETQLQAKEVQLQRCTDVYEHAVASTREALQDVEHQLTRSIPTRERRQELKRRQDRLQAELEEHRQRFVRERRELEDAILRIEAELEELDEAEQVLEETLSPS